MKKAFMDFLFLLICSSILFSQDGKKYLLSSAEVLQILGESKLSYEPTFIEDPTKISPPTYQTIGDQYYTIIEDGKTVLQIYELSDNGKKKYDSAEVSYIDKNFDTAIKHYKDILLTDKNYFKAYTLIADIYYMKENYDSAKYYLNYAINSNFIDYTPHWFLADTYRKTNNDEEALKEMTIAHLLNRNHPTIFDKLKNLRESLDKEWNEWELNPISNTYKKDNRIIIETNKDWMGYAMAEALWKYEPGFVEKIFGKPYDEKSFLYEKEAAGIAANLNLDSMEKVNEIIEDGYFQEMLWYEILSRKYPTTVLLLPNEFFNKIIEYINKYH